ncbi:hypothetical protein EVAR_66768_1 [Eumeta japonica]|uniref:Uncharacterized protein n=1 Tax=Eumeta variegata TaxID=151549 RepID=A0A4C1Z988_EUMVA|nr:hypothetical protein EVAR_66768_1 [Eumeta japonica]
MIWLVVAGKPNQSTPSNMIELSGGRLDVNPANRCCKARSRPAPKKNKKIYMSKIVLNKNKPECTDKNTNHNYNKAYAEEQKLMKSASQSGGSSHVRSSKNQ